MKRRIVTAAVLALGVATVGACSSAGSAPGSPAAAGSAGSGSTISLYQILPLQSQITSLPFFHTPAVAAVDQINAAGGINGHKLKLTVCNDQYTATVALRCAQQGVSNTGYVAMVGNLTGFGPQVNPLFGQAGLANIGPDVITPSDAQAKTSYLIDPGLVGYASMPIIAKNQLHASKIAMVDAAGPSQPTNDQFFEQGAKLGGVKIVKQVTIPQDASDYSQYVAEITSSGAQAIVSSMAPQNNLALWKALQSLHSPLKTVMGDSSVTQPLVDQAGGAAEGDYTTGGIPAPDDSNPYGKAFVAAMKKYQPKETIYSTGGLRAYEAVQLFAAVAKTIKGPITRQSVDQAFSKVNGMKFAWINSLSFTATGPFSLYPRVTTTEVFPNIVKDGKLQTAPSFNLQQAVG
jgi:branched-chain amino acid transport system substrate-binding protein